MKRSASLYFGAILLTTLVAAVLAVLFIAGQTGFVKEFGLINPNDKEMPAGLYFGRVITVLFFGGFAGLCITYWQAIGRQLSAYTETHRVWKEHSSKFVEKSITADEIIEKMRVVAPPGTRIRVALDSWLDDSPNSDPEYVIEGQAVPARQWLGIYQTLASVLVLIGLVGNFYGLAEAVEVLPNLPNAVAKPGSQTSVSQPKIETEEVTSPDLPKDISLKRAVKTTETTTTEEASDTSQLSKEVGMISKGLGVVVISSVLGIGGMAVLLMAVAIQKGILNTVISDEVVLLSAEIGSEVRPSGAAGFSKELQEGLIALPQQLANFDAAASRITNKLDKYTTDFGAVSKSLDRLLENQLQDTQAAYQKYHTTLEEFTKVLVDQQGSVTQLTDTTKRLCDNLEGISQSVKSVAEQSANVGDRLNEIQLQYETYLRSAEDDMKETREVVTKLHERIIDDADSRMEKQTEKLEEALTTVTKSLTTQTRKEVESLAESLVEELAKRTEERHRALLEQLSVLSEKQVAQYDSQLERMESLIDTQSQLEESVRNTLQEGNTLGESMAEAAASLKDAREVLKDNRDKLVQVYDDLSHRQEIALREMVQSWKQTFSSENGNSSLSGQELREMVNGFESLNGDIQRLVESLKTVNSSRDEIGLSESSLRRLSELVSGQRTASVSHNQASEGEASREAVEPIITEATTRIVAAVKQLEDALKAGGIERSTPIPFTPPKIENPKCPSCGYINQTGAVQCRDCGQVLGSGGLETLNGLVHQLIESLDRQPGGTPSNVNVNVEGVVTQLRATHELVATGQEQLRSQIAQLPTEMREALGPEVESISTAVEGLAARLERLPEPARMRRNRRSETQDLDEAPQPEEAAEPAGTKDDAEPAKKVSFFGRIFGGGKK